MEENKKIKNKKKNVKEEIELESTDNLNNEKNEVKENSDIPKIEHVEAQRINNHDKVQRDINTSWILPVVMTFIICLCAFGVFYKYYLKNMVIETTKLVKDVTITETGIADAVEKVYDSVVVVETYVNGKAYSSGTGFVFKTDDDYGYILTNSHVISNSSSVYVTFTNGEKYEVKLIGNDEYSDIAVLRVDKEYVLNVAEIGKSSDLRVGDTAFAVGAPVDALIYSWSVTRGIISGSDRLVTVTLEDNSTYVMNVIQTDAAINSGNSGGPLCNANGEVIGITNLKIASSTIEGMGFAIPIENAVTTAESLIDGKAITRPYLGVSIYDASNIFNNNSGIYIEYVESGSAASKAGLEKGDKITKVNDKEVSTVAYFKYELYKYSVGDKITITYKRNSKEYTTKVTLGSSNTQN